MAGETPEAQEPAPEPQEDPWERFRTEMRGIIDERVPELTRTTLDSYFSELSDAVDAEKETNGSGPAAGGAPGGEPGGDAGAGGGKPPARAAREAPEAKSSGGLLEFLLGKRT